MMVTLLDYSGFQRVLLYCIADLESPTGSQIHAALEEAAHTAVHRQRVYRNLNELVAAGFVAKDPNDDNWTKTYTLTDDGRTALRRFHRWADRRVPDRASSTSDEES